MKFLYQVWTKNGFGDTVLVKTFKTRGPAESLIKQSFPGSGYIVVIPRT